MGVFEQGVAVGARANVVLEHLLMDAEMRVRVEVVLVLVFLLTVCATQTHTQAQDHRKSKVVLTGRSLATQVL